MSKTATGDDLEPDALAAPNRNEQSIALFGPGARGRVSWTGQQTFGGDCSSAPSYNTSIHFEVGIVRDGVVVCRSETTARLDGCKLPNARIVATFRKET